MKQGIVFQGNRISKEGQKAGKVGIIPARSLDLAPERSLFGVFLHDVQGRRQRSHVRIVSSTPVFSYFTERMSLATDDVDRKKLVGTTTAIVSTSGLGWRQAAAPSWICESSA